MFGRRSQRHRCPAPGAARAGRLRRWPLPRASRPGRRSPKRARPAKVEPAAQERRHSEEYYDVKTTVFNALIDTIDLTQLAKLEAAAAREEIRDIVSEIIQIKNVVMSIAEQEELLEDICNDVLGYGPLEPLLARDDIADIMVNGATTTYIEVGRQGAEDRHALCRQRAADEHLPAHRQPGRPPRRRVRARSATRAFPTAAASTSSPRRWPSTGPRSPSASSRRTASSSSSCVKYKSISPEAKTLLEIIGRVRCNVLISGGTGSGKTTLLNCLTGSIDIDERIITCEDSAELQLQQPHVVRLETRPPNLEGEGEITMRDLVKNCLRMRPERIIVGEVRGPEAFDLLQAMNTGHDGSMGTLHANSPREAISRLESMIMMGGFALPAQDHPRDDHRLDRRHRPGLAPARRLAQDHPHHRGDRHGRRRGHPAEPHRVRDHRRGCAAARSSAATARPASPARASGSAPSTTARRRAWRRRWPAPRCTTAAAIRWETRSG